jgi:hypothetical protein
MARTYTKREDEALQIVLTALLDAKVYHGETRDALLTLAGAIGELSAFRFGEIMALLATRGKRV